MNGDLKQEIGVGWCICNLRVTTLMLMLWNLRNVVSLVARDFIVPLSATPLTTRIHGVIGMASIQHVVGQLYTYTKTPTVTVTDVWVPAAQFA